MAGSRGGGSWLFRLRAISCSSGTLSKPAAPTLASVLDLGSLQEHELASSFILVRIYFLHLSFLMRGGRGGERLGCLFIYTHRFRCAAQNYTALTAFVYEITQRGKKILTLAKLTALKIPENISLGGLSCRYIWGYRFYLGNPTCKSSVQQ